jgi:hypothetical protein
MIKTATWKERRWKREDDGTWIDVATGQADPLAEDMTISNFYNFRVIKYGRREYVEVPYAAAHEDPELRFVLDFKKAAPAEEGEEWRGYSEEDQEELLRSHRIPGNQRDHRGRRIILVPIGAWDYWNDKIGAIGMWHPEIK